MPNAKLGCITAAILLSALPVSLTWPLESDPEGLFVRVIDVGAGHAAAIRMPGGLHMVYDAGDFSDKGDSAFAGVQSVIDDGEDIDLLVLSHSDADHLGAADRILKSYTVKRIVRSGYVRKSATWCKANFAIENARLSGTEVIDLSRSPLRPGFAFRFGETFVTVVSGSWRPPESWDGLGPSEKRNAGSIVVQLLFKGRSVLFTGDAVGRKEGDAGDESIATERFMIDNAPAVPIDSDVLIAPHHGSDDASSIEFIRAVSPKWVIFPAGNKYHHPRNATAARYLAAGIDASRMLRTGRDDDEGGKEWPFGRIEKCEDPAGDDDIEIVISESGDLEVAYRDPDPESVRRCTAR